MRSKLIFQVVLLAVVASLGLTGCKNLPWKKKTARAGAEAPVPPLGGTDIASAQRPMWTGEGQRGLFESVYFDYDSARIRPGELSKLDSVAAYMKSKSRAKLIIEGHCDERGTAEYNRALGERRAQAAREELIRLGVDAGRISTISYGKDRPIDLGHDEGAWSRNRRAEFVILDQ